ncbi:MAG: succinate dehydrogenase, cytochrome b subunit, partial [Xanthobacteraceae bacterium]
LPIHFFVLGLSFHGGAKLDTFLRWSDQPLVKFAEGGLVFLLTVHLLGGLRVLIIENFEWRDDLKQLATLASAVAALVSVIFLARMF